MLVSPVGCSVFSYYYFDVGNTQAPHGHAPGGRHRSQDGEPGLDRYLLSGRWRPRVDRLGRDREHRPARDPGHGHLREQRHLRHDRWPDGSYYPYRPEDDHHAQGADPPVGPTPEDGRTDLGSRRARLCRASRAVRQQAAHARQTLDKESARTASLPASVSPSSRSSRNARSISASIPRWPRNGFGTTWNRSSRSA